MAESPQTQPRGLIEKSPFFRVIHGSGIFVANSKKEIILEFLSDYPFIPDDLLMSATSSGSSSSSRERSSSDKVAWELELVITLDVDKAQSLVDLLLKSIREMKKPEGEER